MIRQEWKALSKNWILMIVMVAIVAIPTIYTTLFLGSMWDPYGKTENLPVAVVNLDKSVEYEGSTLEVGKELEDKLKNNSELDFHFVSSKEAEEGIEDGDYYMVITIPENFSKNASTLMDEKPEKMVLEYSTNPGSNYIASKLSETAFARIKNEVAHEVTKTYAETVFDQLTEIGDGMQEAADGSKEIADGVEKLQDGNDTITENLNLLADSSLTFKDGAGTLNVGLGQYTDGVSKVKDGAVQLKDGTSSLAAGSLSLKNGATTLNTGLISLADGTKTLNNSTGTLTTGTASLLKGANQLAEGAKSLKNGTNTYVNGTKTLADAVADYIGGVGKLKTGANQLSGLKNISQVSSGITQLKNAVSVGNEETPALTTATGQLSDGLVTMKNQVTQFAAALDTQNLQKLQAGLQQAGNGIQSAVTGMQTAAGTIEQVADGIDGAKNALNLGVQSINQQINANNEKMADIKNTINEKIDAANAQISSQKEEAKEQINQQVDRAIAAIEEQKAAGTLEEAAAESAIAALKAAKVESAVSGNIDKIEDSDLALTQVQMPEQVSQTVTGVTAAMTNASKGLGDGAVSLSDGAASLGTLAAAIPTDMSLDSLQTLVAGLETASNGALAIKNGVTKVSAALATLEAGTKDFPKAAAGMGTLLDGFTTLTSNDAKILAGAKQLKSNASSLTSGAKQVSDGASDLAAGGKKLSTGATKLAKGIQTVNTGTQKLKNGSGDLLKGCLTLDKGAGQLLTGAETLVDGTTQLTDKNQELKDGASKLADGAVQIQDGASKLADGSMELGDGLTQLSEGSGELKDALGDGAKEVKDVKTNEDTYAMFSNPVEDKETMVSQMENNGHAMSAYMMSVALWVGCIAFCIMYPLMEYKGELKSGFAWWAAKASVIFPMSILMAVVMLGMLHLCNGFNPQNWGATILLTCMASLAFMCIMYFFNVLLGKVGSFLMLIFMVVQLAGSAGTYPIELSGEFVDKIHPFLPFSYTVEAFRVTISGKGDISPALGVLTGIIIVFTIITLWLFQIRSFKEKHDKASFYSFLDENGLA